MEISAVTPTNNSQIAPEPPKPRRYLLGRPVYSAEDRLNRQCPLPTEPEWIEEANRIRAQKAKPVK